MSLRMRLEALAAIALDQSGDAVAQFVDVVLLQDLLARRVARSAEAALVKMLSTR